MIDSTSPLFVAEVIGMTAPAGKRILAMGCGGDDGALCGQLLAAGAHEVVGVDPGAGGLTRTRLTATYQLEPNLCHPLPYPAGYFDLILVVDFSRLLFPGPTLGNMRRWLADTGRVVTVARSHSIDAVRGALQAAGLVPVMENNSDGLSDWAIIAARPQPSGVDQPGAIPDPWSGSRRIRVLVVPDTAGRQDWTTAVGKVARDLSENPDLTLGIALPLALLEARPTALDLALHGLHHNVLFIGAPCEDDGWLRLMAGAILLVDVACNPALLVHAHWVGLPVERVSNDAGDPGVNGMAARPPAPATCRKERRSSAGNPISFGPGFHEVEEEWRWISENATLSVASPDHATTLSFDLACGDAAQYANFPFDVTVSAGDASMHMLGFETSGQVRKVELQIDAGRGDVPISFESAETFVPAKSGRSTDGRHLSVRIGHIRLNGVPVIEQRAAPNRSAPASGFQLRGFARNADYRSALEIYTQDPTVLIELSSRCNFHCHYCRSAQSKRQKSFMKRELFDRLLPQLKGFTSQDIRLHVDGEPTIHPEFLEMALAVNRAGYRVGLATNASNLKPTFLPIDMAVVVNLSTSPEELALRTFMMYARYLEQIRQYVRRWAEIPNTQHLVLKVYASMHERLEPQLLEKKKCFAHDFVEQVGLGSFGTWSDQGLLHSFGYSKSAKEHFSFVVQPLAEGGLYPNLSGVHLPGAAVAPEHGFCDGPWKTLAVLSDGTVSYCCVDVTGATGFTRPEEIWQRSLKDIWLNHPAIGSDREEFLVGRTARQVCRQCLASTPNRESYLFQEDFPYPPRPSSRPQSLHGGVM